MTKLIAALKSTVGWLSNHHPLARLNRVPVITFIVLVLSLVMIEGARNSDYNLIKTVGVDAAPSVVLAQEIKSGLATMAADLYTELDARPGENPELVKDYDANRVKVNQAIVKAAQNITYTNDDEHLHQSEPNGEVGPINRLQEGYASFLQLSAQARVYHDTADTAAMVNVVHAISDVVNKQILPAADALAMVNDAHLQAKYASRLNHFYMGLAATLGVGGLYLLYMLYVQGVLLTRTFKRGFNPMFAAASVLAVVLFGYCANSFRMASDDLYTAGTAAYPSVKVLAQTRASLLAAKAEESLWLLDRDNAGAHAQAFSDFANKIGKFGSGQTADLVNQLVAKGYARGGLGYVTISKGDPVPAQVFSGLLADEENNITFPGELAAATNTVKAFEDYKKVDEQVRALEAQGQHAKAVSLLVGSNAGQGNYVFGKLLDDKATNGTLGSVFKINVDYQNEAVQSAFNDIGLLELGVPFVLVIIQLLVFGGTMVLRSSISPERAAARWRKLAKA